MPPTSIRVLVVDDSALIRQMLTRALAMDPRVQVIGSARDGVEAIEKARDLEPDVITLDIEMPELNGLEALPHIRKNSPARVVMLSSLDDPETTYKALSLGAVDFLAKPSAGVATSITELTEVLLKKIKTAYRITPERAALVVQANAAELFKTAEPAIAVAPPTITATRISACVAIASSTGGPPALERVFSGLQASMPATYIVVQHLPAGFADSLARRLDSVSEVKVSIAEEGMHLEPGHAYIAPHGSHLVVERSEGQPVLRMTDGPSLHGVKPAGDYLMKSVASIFGGHSVGVVLTGMGSDGADGALSIKKAGGDIVVQDEPTSIVWGMPGATVRSGATNRQVPIGLVAAEIRRAVRARSGGEYN